MPNLTSVTITAGVPTVGTGTVSTIDALMADGGQVTLGAKADAKSTATDTTAVTVMSVLKQISASVQAPPSQAVTNAGTFATQAVNTDILLTSLAPTSAAFTPAATSHTAKDCVGAATTFTTVGASGKQVMIVGATFSIATTTPVASAFRLHLFNAAPTVIADDAAFTLASADIAKYLGWIDLGTAFDLDSTAQWISQDGLAKPVLLTTANIIGYLQNLTTVTLEAVAHTVTLFTVPLS